jgi:hypothetical protein
MVALVPMHTTMPTADYVLQVPIRIENMRNLSSATLSCDIFHFGTSPADRQSLGAPGGGSVSVPIVDGAYNGTLQVTVTVSSANAIRYTPNTYGCFLVFRWRNPDGTEFLESTRTSNERAIAYTRLTGQEISENTTEITGPLPPG